MTRAVLLRAAAAGMPAVGEVVQAVVGCGRPETGHPVGSRARQASSGRRRLHGLTHGTGGRLRSRRPLASRVIAAGLLAVPPLLTLATPSAAEAPVAVGWWNLAHQLVEPPAPPGVDEGELLLQGGGASPTAYAALRFALPSGAVAGVLTLPVDPDGGPARADAVTVCRAGAAWEPAENGAYADAPAPDCAVRLPAVVAPDGAALLVADVARLARGETLDLVLLPGPSDRVVLAAPTAAALAVSRSPEVPEPAPAVTEPPPPAADPSTSTPVAAPEPEAPAPGGPAPDQLAAGPAFPAAPPEPVTAPAAGLAVAPVLTEAVPAASALPPASVTASRPLVPAAFDDDRTRVLVVLEALLVLAFFGLLGWGPFARLHALTGEPAPVAATSRGIGRFTRERTGAAPRL